MSPERFVELTARRGESRVGCSGKNRRAMATSDRCFDLVREMKQAIYNHRQRLVESAKVRIVKPAARLFELVLFQPMLRSRRLCGLQPLSRQSAVRVSRLP